MSALRSSDASGRRSRLVGLAAALVTAVVAGALAIEAVRDRRATREAFPRAVGSLSVEGLGASVTLDRDARGVPHVEAASESDAFFGLGFAHAQDRLAQMRWWAVLARGRSAEVVGLPGVEADRLARILGLGRLADQQLPRLSRSTRVALEAYAAGVNAHIDLVERGEVGPPLALLRLELPLERWRPEDSLALLKLHAWGLSSSVDASLLLSELIQRVGATSARRFFPRSDQRAPLPPPDATVAIPRPARLAAGSPLRRALGLSSPGIGSSAWVIGGAHTESGLPIVVGDAHFEPTAPAHLYLAHVRAGDLDVVGTTLPGLPVFWSGRNRHVAWASVHARAVVTDLFTETLHPADPTRYHDGEGWRPVSERIETILVHGGEAQTLAVRSTRHGPLLPGPEGGEPVAVAWTGAGDDRASGITSMLRVARAEGAEALVDALSTHREPVLAVVYADVEGEAGVQVAGWIPRREILPGLLPLPGRARWYDWEERVAYEDLPRAQLARGEGWLVAADNRLDRDDSEVPIEWLWRSGVRAERIDVRVRAGVAAGPVDLRSSSAILSDVELPRSLRLARIALGLVEPGRALGPEALELAGILRDWDGRAGRESVAAAAYHVFLAELTEALLAERLGASLLARYLSLSQTDPEQLALGVLEMVSEPEAAGVERERIADGVRESLNRAALSLAFRLGPNRRRWTWGALHPIEFRPFGPFQRVWPRPPGLGPHPYGGGASSIQAAAPDPDGPFSTRVASIARLAIDLGAPSQVLASIAPGQSGHPEHPNFRDGLARWLEGRLGLLPTSRLLIDEGRVARLVLEPVR